MVNGKTPYVRCGQRMDPLDRSSVSGVSDGDFTRLLNKILYHIIRDNTFIVNHRRFYLSPFDRCYSYQYPPLYDASSNIDVRYITKSLRNAIFCARNKSRMRQKSA